MNPIKELALNSLLLIPTLSPSPDNWSFVFPSIDLNDLFVISTETTIPVCPVPFPGRLIINICPGFTNPGFFLAASIVIFSDESALLQ